jgi:glutathione S-transferase
VCADRDVRVGAFRQSLQPRMTLAAQSWLGGDAPQYADYIVFGCLQWRAASVRFAYQHGRRQ